MYIVYSHAPLKAKGRHLASLEKPEESETTGYRLSLVHGAFFVRTGDEAGCRLCKHWLHAWIHKSQTSDRHMQLTRNRKLIWRRPDKGGFKVERGSTSGWEGLYFRLRGALLQVERGSTAGWEGVYSGWELLYKRLGLWTTKFPVYLRKYFPHWTSCSQSILVPS